MKRILVLGGTLLALLVAAVLALPFIIPHDFIAGQLKQAVKAETGRTLTIGEAPKLVFWPDFAVTLKDVRLSTPPGMYEGQVAQMDEMRIRVEVASLFNRRLDIKELHLIRPKLSLVIDGEGRPNWVLEKTRGEQGGGSSPGIETGSIAPITIEDGDVRFLDERSGKVFMAEKVDLTITLDSLTGPVAVKGTLTALGDDIALSFSAKTPGELAAAGSPLSLAVKSKRLDFSFSGLAAMQDGLTLDGTITAAADSLRELGRWARIPVPDGAGFGPARIKGQIALSGTNMKLSKAKITLDGLSAGGDVALELSGRPKVTANLGFDTIDVNRYLPPQEAAPEAAAGQTGWSAAPIALAGLGVVDAQLKLSANKLLYRSLATGKIAIDATLKNGKFDARLGQIALYGGKAQGRLVLDGAAKVPAVQVTLDAQGFDGLRLLRDYAGLDRFEGVAGAKLNLAANGRSQQELVSSLNGTAAFSFANGAVRGIDIEAMIEDVATNVLNGWRQGPDAKTPFDSLRASFTLVNGIATTNDLNFTSPVLTVGGGGLVDLPRQALNLKVSPTLTLAAAQGLDLAGLAVPIIVKGPWANPKIYPDIAGILDNPQAAYDTLRKIVDEGTTASLKEKGAEIKNQIKDKVADEIGKALGDDQAGEDAGNMIEEQSQKLLEGLFGNN
ncbi:AsmA family protein [Nordella sp. HKS 07]|uniref:AsmA family protein n=1 Tax=Nordella sp. HKS 07 TaxID=2712222 RepID=UPI0013E17E4D|nr:AsmA family protein [Nordella sp. HKS 07]QIG49130.1 AsmA family protein [Nordella sp. HKS 07]